MPGPMSKNNTGQRVSAEMKNVGQNTIRIPPHNICDFSWKDLILRNHSTDGRNFLKSHLLTYLAFDAGYQLETWLGLLTVPHMASLFALVLFQHNVSGSQLFMLSLREPQTRILRNEAETALLFIV